MKIIFGERGCGKTTELIRLVKENNGILLVRNNDHAKYLITKCGLTQDQCIPWEDAIDGLLLTRMARTRNVYIDDVDEFFFRHFGFPVEGISFTDI